MASSLNEWPSGLELSCPAEAGGLPLILAHAGGPTTTPYPPARRVSFSELLGSDIKPTRAARIQRILGVR